MLGMQPLQVDAGFGCIGDLGQHRLRIAQARRHAVELAELDRNGPAAAGVARIFQNSEIELDLVQGLVVDRVGKVAGRRQLEVRTRKPPIVGAQHLVDGGLRLAREAHVGHPDRIAARGIEGGERREVLRVCIPGKRRVLQLGADARNDWRRFRRRRGGVGRRRGLRFGRGLGGIVRGWGCVGGIGAARVRVGLGGGVVLRVSRRKRQTAAQKDETSPS